MAICFSTEGMIGILFDIKITSYFCHIQRAWRMLNFKKAFFQLNAFYFKEHVLEKTKIILKSSSSSHINSSRVSAVVPLSRLITDCVFALW